MLNRTRKTHNYLSLSLMTIVGWHKNCNLYHSFFVIPSWHCHCSWVFAPCVLSLGDQPVRVILRTQPMFVPSLEIYLLLLHRMGSPQSHLMITPAFGSGKPKGQADPVEMEIKEWLQQPTPLKMPKKKKSLHIVFCNKQSVRQTEE